MTWPSYVHMPRALCLQCLPLHRAVQNVAFIHLVHESGAEFMAQNAEVGGLGCQLTLAHGRTRS